MTEQLSASHVELNSTKCHKKLRASFEVIRFWVPLRNVGRNKQAECQHLAFVSRNAVLCVMLVTQLAGRLAVPIRAALPDPYCWLCESYEMAIVEEVTKFVLD